MKILANWNLPSVFHIFLLVFTLMLTGCEQRELSIQELEQKAEKNNPEAQFRLGKLYLFGAQGTSENKAHAFKWLVKSANQGYAPGEYLLGTMYLEGSKDVPKSRMEAFKYFQRAAESGFPSAQNKMGQRYLHGWDVEKDFVVAAKWFERAAKKGLADAQYNLGQRYFKAEGLKQSDEIATKWLFKAANQGHFSAQYLLALRYAEGGAGRIDHVQAYKWATIANQDSVIKAISKTMKPEQIQEAKVLAESFQPILEIDPLEPPESNLIYWMIGIPTVGLYGAAFYLLCKRRKLVRDTLQESAVA